MYQTATFACIRLSSGHIMYTWRITGSMYILNGYTLFFTITFGIMSNIHDNKRCRCRRCRSNEDGQITGKCETNEYTRSSWHTQTQAREHFYIHVFGHWGAFTFFWFEKYPSATICSNSIRAGNYRLGYCWWVNFSICFLKQIKNTKIAQSSIFNSVPMNSKRRENAKWSK